MEGRFQDTLYKKNQLLRRNTWKKNKIYRDFNLILARIIHDMIGHYDSLSDWNSNKLENGFFIAIGPRSFEPGSDPVATFKDRIKEMEILLKKASEEGKNFQSHHQIQYGQTKESQKREILYTYIDEQGQKHKYYSLMLTLDDIHISENQLSIEASLEQGNPKTKDLSISEFGIYTKYPPGSPNVFLLNYGHHSEIQKDNDITLTRKIEFIF
ncbi:MAG: hypothetical protein D6805_08165 [Planctomycetota bacterium]|nr:MAG: hypothetical protein D6805_08165 [Planctomycetota bacterium]